MTGAPSKPLEDHDKDDKSLPIYNVNNTAAYDKALSEQALLDADAGSRYGFRSRAFES